MTRRKKHILIALGLSLLGLDQAQAQQTAMFGQFQYNMLELNPAYAGYRETFNVTAINRNQWIGFKGAPVTQTISFNKPAKADEVAFGGSISNDHIGPTNSFSMAGDIAYRIKYRNRQRTVLAFGLKPQFSIYQNNLTGVDIIEDGDESFLRNENGVGLFNIGFGSFLYGKTYFIGVSAPKLIRNRLVKRGSTLFDYMEGREELTYYLTAGKIFRTKNRQVKIYPAVLFKATKNAPISGGAFLNLLLMNQFKVGGYYNFKEVAGAIFQWQLNKQLRVGYTLEMPVTSLFGTNLGSHEIMINYAIKKGRTAIIYPKHF